MLPWGESGSIGSGCYSLIPSLEPMSLDEIVQIGRVNTHMPADPYMRQRASAYSCANLMHGDLQPLGSLTLGHQCGFTLCHDALVG